MGEPAYERNLSRCLSDRDQQNSGRADVRGAILRVVNDLDESLRACREKEYPAHEQCGDFRSHASKMGKVADVLQAYGDLDEAAHARHEEDWPVQERIGDVCQRAVAVSSIADVLLDSSSLDEALKALQEALRVQQEEHLPAFNEKRTKPPTRHVVSPRTASNDLAKYPMYDDYKRRLFHPERWYMRQKALVALIPNWAARLFAIGIVSAAGGFVAVWFTDNGLPALILALGLATAAIGLQAGERAIADGRKR